MGGANEKKAALDAAGCRVGNSALAIVLQARLFASFRAEPAIMSLVAVDEYEERVRCGVLLVLRQFAERRYGFFK